MKPSRGAPAHAYQQAANLLESAFVNNPEEKELSRTRTPLPQHLPAPAAQRETAPQTIRRAPLRATLAINGGQYDQAIAHLRLVRD